MLATVLGISKVIGIALLVILGLLLVLLLLLLFVPLRYKADGFLPAVHLASQDGEEKPFLPPGTKAEIRFSWLLHLVNGGFLYPERPEFFLRLAFITLIPRKRKPAPEPAHQPEQDAWDGRKDEDDQAEETASVEELPAEEAATEDAESEAVAEIAAAENPTEETSEEAEGETASAEHIWPTEQASEEAMEAEKPTILDFLEMVGDFFRKLIQTPEKVFSKIRYTISAVCDKMTKIEQIQATLQNDIFRRAFDKACREIGIALRAILPRQMKGHIRYGTG
ncbi:MAG: hypothetical protein IJT34_00880, partial [Butyrivibrio sp.]|nr:hypothetical protein [Butyrivibrio sp.]